MITERRKDFTLRQPGEWIGACIVQMHSISKRPLKNRALSPKFYSAALKNYNLYSVFEEIFDWRGTILIVKDMCVITTIITVYIGVRYADAHINHKLARVYIIKSNCVSFSGYHVCSAISI